METMRALRGLECATALHAPRLAETCAHLYVLRLCCGIYHHCIWWPPVDILLTEPAQQTIRCADCRDQSATQIELDQSTHTVLQLLFSRNRQIDADQTNRRI